MKLTQRLTDKKTPAPLRDERTEPARAQSPEAQQAVITNLKKRLQAAVVDEVDLRGLQNLDAAALREKLAPAVDSIIGRDDTGRRLNPERRALLAKLILDEIAGFGPLEPLLSDPTVNDIVVNTFDTIYVERKGVLERTELRFDDNEHLYNVIQRIVSRVGRRIDESSPMVDARLPDGSRINAVIPPVSPDGPLLSIRRFAGSRLTANDLVSSGTASKQLMRYLAACVRSRCNLIISGGTGAGKTTLLNILSAFIPKHERVVTIEDSAELSLHGQHIVRLEARPPNIEGRGEITLRDLVRNSLRMRPDRIVVGEVRGAEALDMLQAMNTGHEGSMATIHANTSQEAADRLMMMLALAGVSLSAENMAQFVGRSIRVIVQISRFPDGARRITSVAEVHGSDNDQIRVHEVFSFTHGIGDKHGGAGFVCHGGSRLGRRFAEAGVSFDMSAEGSR